MQTMSPEQEYRVAADHMQSLMDRLPEMEEAAERHRVQTVLRRVEQQKRACDDLEQALEILKRGTPARFSMTPDLHTRAIEEKELRLARERKRLEHLMADLPYPTVDEALAHLMPTDELNESTRALNRFRDDYAYTYEQCLRFAET